MDIPKIGRLASMPKPERDELRIAVDEMRRSIDATIEFEQLRAKIRGEKMKALIGAGFTRGEALQIIIGDK